MLAIVQQKVEKIRLRRAVGFSSLNRSRTGVLRTGRVSAQPRGPARDHPGRVASPAAVAPPGAAACERKLGRRRAARSGSWSPCRQLRGSARCNSRPRVSRGRVSPSPCRLRPCGLVRLPVNASSAVAVLRGRVAGHRVSGRAAWRDASSAACAAWSGQPGVMSAVVAWPGVVRRLCREVASAGRDVSGGRVAWRGRL